MAGQMLSVLPPLEESLLEEVVKNFVRERQDALDRFSRLKIGLNRHPCGRLRRRRRGLFPRGV